MIGVQRMISKYVIPPKVVERDCMYKVKVDVHGYRALLCGGTAPKRRLGARLQRDHGYDLQQIYTQEWAGSFSSQTFGGAIFAMDDWIEVAAHLKNKNGSYLKEGELRVHFGKYLRHHFCEGDFRGCGGQCCALPGDTIYWVFREPYRVVTRWEARTDEELREQGWLEQGGWLFRHCELYREDPSQLDG